MSRRRKITVELTEAQFRALAGAVTAGQYDLETEIEDFPGSEQAPEQRRQHAAGERAWEKIRAAWYREETR